MRLLSFINSDISRLFSFSLFNLYNLLENPYSQFFVYMKALNLAVSGKVTEHVVPSFKKMDDFLSEWNLGTKDKRDLFLTVANVLKDSKRWVCVYVYACDEVATETSYWVICFYTFSSAKESFDYLVKYLETFSGDDALALAEAKEEAVRAVVEFVKSPDMFQVMFGIDFRDQRSTLVLKIYWKFLVLYIFSNFVRNINLYCRVESDNFSKHT